MSLCSFVANGRSQAFPDASSEENSWLMHEIDYPGLGNDALLTKEGMPEKDRADRRVIEQALAALKPSSG